MPLEFGLWRVDHQPVRLSPVLMPLESRLETLIEQDPSLLGRELMIIGRQVPTDFGQFIDLLAVDSDGNLHVLELKRDKTPRDVVAQLLDYASWVSELSNTQVREIFDKFSPEQAFDTAFDEKFGQGPPDQLNAELSLAIIASSVDHSTERIVSYLNKQFSVPINVVFFRYFEDCSHSYLARTWLVEDTGTSPTAARGPARVTAPWNGHDWYVSFGEYDEGGVRSWEDAVRFGFVSAGGGEWYSRTLTKLPEGARVFVYIPKRGYVGVGTVQGPARRASEAVLTIDGADRPFLDLPLRGSYRHPAELAGEDKAAEYVVPVAWLETVPASDAFWQPGMFANQNSACPLRNQFTIDKVIERFALDVEPQLI
jgi:Endonuclease NucS